MRINIPGTKILNENIYVYMDRYKMKKVATVENNLVLSRIEWFHFFQKMISKLALYEFNLSLLCPLHA